MKQYTQRDVGVLNTRSTDYIYAIHKIYNFFLKIIGWKPYMS